MPGEAPSRVLLWLDETWIAAIVRETLYGYPALESVHAIGMAMMIGSIGLLNLRLLGYERELPVPGVRQLLPLAWTGFALNALSGTALFVSDSFYFFDSITFRVKMLLIVLAGINAALLGRHARALSFASDAVPSAAVRLLAASSLVFWFAALIAGRLLAYTP